MGVDLSFDGFDDAEDRLHTGHGCFMLYRLHGACPEDRSGMVEDDEREGPHFADPDALAAAVPKAVEEWHRHMDSLPGDGPITAEDLDGMRLFLGTVVAHVRARASRGQRTEVWISF